jgi:hypothetical protein
MTELSFGVGDLASLSHLFDSPKAADPKCSFVAYQAIDTGFIALKQAVSTQSLTDEGVGR